MHDPAECGSAQGQLYCAIRTNGRLEHAVKSTVNNAQNKIIGSGAGTIEPARPAVEGKVNGALPPLKQTSVVGEAGHLVALFGKFAAFWSIEIAHKGRKLLAAWGS